MNKRVYVIVNESLYSDNSCSSGCSYVCDTLEKALNMLEIIKQDEIEEYGLNDWDITDDIRDYENGFIIELGDEYTKYEIVEKELI